MAQPERVCLGELVDLVAQLQRDQAQSERDLRARDAAIGRELRDRSQNQAGLLVGWLERVEDAHQPLPGAHAAAGLRTAAGLLALLGLALGWASAAAVYHYDGVNPVNVIHVLAVYVVAPLILLALTVLAAVTGLGPAGEAVRAISPGRLIGLLLRLLPQRYREGADMLLSTGRRHQRLLGAVQKWLVLTASQLFATAFFLGAVLGTIHLVVFTDLVFGWSTTLEAGADELHTVTQGLALPWGWAWADATPAREVVEATRYVRAMRGLPAGDVEAGSPWRAWWPFLLMATLTYGLLPRVVCLAVARAALGGAVRRSFLHVPGTAVVLDRLAPVVDIQTSGDEPGPQPEPRAAGAEAGPPAGPVAATINWAEAADAPGALAAGGARSLEQDRQTIANAAARAAEGGRLVILARGWEPPMLELLDFLQDLRGAVGEQTLVEVRPQQADAAHMAEWRRKLAGLDDSRLIVTAPAEVHHA